MPKVSKVNTLESDAKAWLDSELIKRNFSGYEELEQMLAEKGYYIGKSSLHRYGVDLKAKTEAIKASTEMAKAINAEVQDDEGAMGQTLVALAQEQLFQLLLAAGEGDDGLDPKSLSQITNAISRVTRANLAQKQYASEVKARAKAAADKIEKLAASGGLSKETRKVIRKEILGISDD